MKGDIAIHLPDHISYENGATLGTGLSTIALSMYSPKTLNLPIPQFPIEKRAKAEKFIFIYGGSSASGTLAIQFAKMYAVFCFQYSMMRTNNHSIGLNLQ
jgi:NADPH:quinone reductase-like Zn-dependent oxidoreductase